MTGLAIYNWRGYNGSKKNAIAAGLTSDVYSQPVPHRVLDDQACCHTCPVPPKLQVPGKPRRVKEMTGYSDAGKGVVNVCQNAENVNQAGFPRRVVDAEDGAPIVVKGNDTAIIS
jgi:hypothetical protein